MPSQHPEQHPEQHPGQPQPEAPAELAPEDFYFEGPYLIFTALYHRKRGFCCNNDCLHCPYR